MSTTPGTSGANTQIQTTETRNNRNTPAPRVHYNDDRAMQWAILGVAALGEVGKIVQATRDRDERELRRQIEEEHRIRETDMQYMQQSRMHNRAKMEGALQERNAAKQEIHALKDERMKQVEMERRQPSETNDFYKFLCFVFAAFIVVLILQQNSHIFPGLVYRF